VFTLPSGTGAQYLTLTTDNEIFQSFECIKSGGRFDYALGGAGTGHRSADGPWATNIFSRPGSPKKIDVRWYQPSVGVVQFQVFDDSGSWVSLHSKNFTADLDGNTWKMTQGFRLVVGGYVDWWITLEKPIGTIFYTASGQGGPYVGFSTGSNDSYGYTWGASGGTYGTCDWSYVNSLDFYVPPDPFDVDSCQDISADQRLLPGDNLQVEGAGLERATDCCLYLISPPGSEKRKLFDFDAVDSLEGHFLTGTVPATWWEITPAGIASTLWDFLSGLFQEEGEKVEFWCGESGGAVVYRCDVVFEAGVPPMIPGPDGGPGGEGDPGGWVDDGTAGRGVDRSGSGWTRSQEYPVPAAGKRPTAAEVDTAFSPVGPSDYEIEESGCDPCSIFRMKMDRDLVNAERQIRKFEYWQRERELHEAREIMLQLENFRQEFIFSFCHVDPLDTPFVDQTLAMWGETWRATIRKGLLSTQGLAQMALHSAWLASVSGFPMNETRLQEYLGNNGPLTLQPIGPDGGYEELP